MRDCSFETDRLVVGDWSRLLTGVAPESVRDEFVMALMTDAVSRDLPPGWQGPYDVGRAATWFAQREREGTILLVVDRSEARPVGVLILSEADDTDASADIRLGYILAERAWGSGLATELVAGFITWCRAQGAIRSLVAGVTDRDGASARVLEKNGFLPIAADAAEPGVGVEYALHLAT